MRKLLAFLIALAVSLSLAVAPGSAQMTTMGAGGPGGRGAATDQQHRHDCAPADAVHCLKSSSVSGRELVREALPE